jgi:hypothetical protein
MPIIMHSMNVFNSNFYYFLSSPIIPFQELGQHDGSKCTKSLQQECSSLSMYNMQKGRVGGDAGTCQNKSINS